MRCNVMPLSLRQQLIIVGACVLALALLGVAWGHWQAGQQFVREQLASHTHETATALALALSSGLRDGDTALVKTTLLPVFDRGYYRRIVISDAAGRTVTEMSQPGQPQPVPGWFAELAGWQPPQARAMVTAGWREVGQVTVEGDTAFALRQLWQGALTTAIWLGVLYLAALAVMSFWLKRLLAPMAAVERVAAAATLRRIEPIEIHTRTPELQRFIAGFNRLAVMVNARFSEEEARAERFRRAALTDALTGLPNRLGLESLGSLANPSWLGLLHVDGVAHINRLLGHSLADDFIKAAAHNIQVFFPAGQIARLRGACFAIVHAAEDEEVIRQDSRRLLGALAQLAAQFSVKESNAALGWIRFDSITRWEQRLAAADQALLTAMGKPADAIHISRELLRPEGLPSAEAFMRHVRAMVASEKLYLALQAVRSLPEGTRLPTEVLLRLPGPSGELLAAREFLPIVKRQQAAALLDRAMLMRLRAVIEAGQIEPGPLAINLSAESFAERQLPDWLVGALQGWPSAYPLFVELDEGEVLAWPDAATRFAAFLRAHGMMLAIDHFGLRAGGLAALRRLLPNYVKLDASLSQGLEAAERRFQVEALVRAAHHLEIPVWAQAVEAAKALSVLSEMGITGAQGYALSPERLL